MGKSVRPPLERDLPAEISLKDFLGTSEERREALRIFTTYADVFASDKSSLGRTTVMQHQIPTCDGIPVNQRHRHIVPNQLVVKEHLQVESEQLCLARCAGLEEEWCPAHMRGLSTAERQSKARCFSFT